MSEEKDKLTIFPLSANPNLTKSEVPALEVYYQHLDAAFSEPRICNIAVTGAFGVGKSSLIQSYEKNRKEKTKENTKDFLYVSLGNYLKNDGGNDGTLNSLERQLLLQLYTKFKKNELPATKFKMIPEHSHRALFACGFGVFLCMVLLLVFHFEIGTLIDQLWSSAEFHRKKKFIHLLIYLVTLLCISVAVGCGAYQLVPRIQTGKLKLAVKSENVEVNYDDDTAEDYLDKYTTEVVYCLEQIADKNDVIIFEDLDRLKEENCLAIFARLRKLNHLVNARLKRDSKQLRFVYVISDAIIAKLKSEKFFDYILPVIPIMNERTSEKILRDGLGIINDQLKNIPYITTAKHTEIKKSIDLQNISTIIALIARDLYDYRIQNNILNDYSLLFHIYISSHRNIFSDNVAEQLLAFAVYKNLWSEDYALMQQGKSKVFPIRFDEDYHGVVSDKSYLLEELISGGYLTNQCLYFIGYDRENIISWWKKCLNENFVGTMNSINEQDEEARACVESQWALLMKEHTTDEEVCASIRYVVRVGDKNTDWFFQDRTIRQCLEMLEKYNEDISLFFTVAGYEECEFSVFEKCKDWNATLNETWKQTQLNVFKKGTKKYPHSRKIKIDKTREPVDLKTFVENRTD